MRGIDIPERAEGLRERQRDLLAKKEGLENYRDFCETSQYTLLMRMIKLHDWPTAAAKLIEKGCDVNARNRDGETALRIAKVYKRQKTEEVLVGQAAVDTGADDLFRAAGMADNSMTEDKFIQMLTPFDEQFKALTADSPKLQYDRAHSTSSFDRQEFVNQLTYVGEEWKHGPDGDARHHDWPTAAKALVDKCTSCEMGRRLPAHRRARERLIRVPYVQATRKDLATALHIAARNDRRETALVLLGYDDDAHSLANAKDRDLRDARAYTCGTRSTGGKV